MTISINLQAELDAMYNLILFYENNDIITDDLFHDLKNKTSDAISVFESTDKKTILNKLKKINNLFIELKDTNKITTYLKIQLSIINKVKSLCK